MCGIRGDGHVKLAASVEFMHTATLLHDDVVDESDMRRGKAAARHGLGQPGERAGRRLPARPGLQDDGRGRLARRARHPLQRRGDHRRGRGHAARRGQEHGDHRGRIPGGDPGQDRGAVLRRGRGRPGARRRRPGGARRVPLLRHQSRPRLPARSTTRSTTAASSTDLGKRVGDDFREGKITLPVVLSYRRGTDADRAFWKRVLEDGAIERRRPRTGDRA